MAAGSSEDPSGRFGRIPREGPQHRNRYETYKIAADRAVVNVGVTHDTAEFAVESIRRWWKLAGRKRKPAAKRILICADAGGSNGSRSRAWKLHLQELVDELGMAITVCHYPPGTSKWNKIEDRLFSFISLTWKGQPLINYETVVNLIGATKTKSGLRVKAVRAARDGHSKHGRSSGPLLTQFVSP